MKILLKSRLISLLAVFLAVIGMVPHLYADEFTDGTITIPRSGKEIVSLPSPEAAGLCRHIDHAIDYSTGCVSLSFPLFTYDCGDITLPLSISYRTGGIKADSDAGALGVGWDLNCGGFVSRSVVGMPDDADGVEFSSTKSDLAFLKKLYANTADAMYDRYSFSAGSYSGSFIILNGNTIHHLTPTDVLVVRTSAGFDITTPDGTLYHYDIPETLKYSYESSPITAAFRSPNYTCECMWRLSKIESPSRNDAVSFIYESAPDITKASYQATVAATWDSETKKARWAASSTIPLKSVAIHTYTNRHRIASISGRDGSVSFSYDTTDKNRCTGLTVKNNQGSTVRKVSFGSGRTLSSYRITDSASNLLDGADFSYSLAMGSDSDRDFFGYRNGGGVKSAVSYNPDSLAIENDPKKSALDKLLRPSWVRQPVLAYTRSESLAKVVTVAGTETMFDYELNDGGYFLTYGRIAPGLRLKKETVTDYNTGNKRVRALTYSAPVPSVDFSALQAEDFVSVSGSYNGPLNQAPTTTFTTGASIAASCRLQGAAIENACVYYGKVTESITGSGITLPIITDYEYDTSGACSKLYRHNNSWSATDRRVAGSRAQGDLIFKENYDLTPGYVYERLLTINTAGGYFKEIIGDRAPLSKVTRWLTKPDGTKRVWRCTEYHNSLSTTEHEMGSYSEPVIRLHYEVSPTVEHYDFQSTSDFNRFAINATSVKVYVDSITETETDERGTMHTVVRRMGYNNHRLKWVTGSGKLIQIQTDDPPVVTLHSYLPDPEIPGTRTASNSLPRTCVIGCGDEWIRTDYIYSSTSDTPQMRQLDAAGQLSLPVEIYYTTGHGFEYDATAVSERFTYVTGKNAGDMRLSSDVIRSKADGKWFTLDSISVGAHDSYGNPLLVSRNGGTPSYYTWTNSGTTLSTAATAGQKTTYSFTPLVGCTSAKTPSGLTTAYAYSGSRLSSVSVGGTRLKSYSYSVHGTDSRSSATNCVSEETVIDAATSICTTSYFDGFGNSTGSVTSDKARSSGIATLDVYDAAGRLTRSYTPRPAASPYDVPSAQNPSGDAVPYSVITYSGSGDSRPLSATIPGEEYSGHSSKTRHLFSVAHSGGAETALSCRRYRPGAVSGSVTLAGYYPKGALSVEETTDGDGRCSLTFTDFRGRLILTRSFLKAGATVTSVQSGQWTDTYNIYDDAGNLLCVVTPSAAPLMTAKGSTWSDTAASPLAQCFRYSYDGAMRLRSKKSPDAAAVKYWYDATGALVLTQDGSQRSRGVCSFALADSLGRPAVSGEGTYSDALAAQVERCHVVATRGTASGNLNGYVPNVPLASAVVFSSSYYDDYSHLSLSCFSRLSKKLATHSPPSHKTAPTGLPTGSWSKVLSSSALTVVAGTDSALVARNGYLESTSGALYYDSFDRLIATATVDHIGGLSIGTSAYNTAGMPTATQFSRWPLTADEDTETHSYSYTYDALGRVSTVKLTRDGTVYTVQRNSYDAIGQLARMSYGNGCGVSYSYKPSGAVAYIEAANAAGGGTFYQTLSYATGRTPSYSGNIGSIDWRGKDGIGRHYGFTYDGLGRLTSAAYSETVKRPAANVASGTVSYSTAYTYGPDSRPLTVTRQGVRSFIKSLNSTTVPIFGEVDNLTFTYSGSRLIKVSDTVGSLIYAGASDFNDGADTATEYTYDEDGRMTSDANKDITSIKYNALGLPAEITFSDGCSITNRYSADGTLLQRVKAEPLKFIIPVNQADLVIKPATTKTTDNHIGALTIRNSVVTRIDTPTGYFADGKMHYYVKDYQGNIRQVTDADGNVEQDNHYYPYGMLMAESSDILATARGGNVINPNPYLFGAKEYLTTAGANLLDFTARTYDPSLPLFQTQDPKAWDYTPFNAYTYCGGDPVNYIDPTGQDALLLLEDDLITVKANIILMGEHASEDIAQIYYEDIMNTWGTIDKFSYEGKTYDVKWDVNVSIKGDEAIDYNGINNYMEVIMDGGKASSVTGTNHGIIRAVSDMGLSLSEDCPMSHEFGHMLGLIDRYNPTTNKPESKEWANDVMAEPAFQLKTVKNHHLETLFKPIIYTDKIYNMLRNFPIVDRFVPKDTKYWINNKTRAEKPKK